MSISFKFLCDNAFLKLELSLSISSCGKPTSPESFVSLLYLFSYDSVSGDNLQCDLIYANSFLNASKFIASGQSQSASPTSSFLGISLSFL